TIAARQLLSSLLIFEPSSVRLYIKPFEPNTKPTTGSFTFCESIDLPAPISISATDPSTPTFQPELLRNLSSAALVMKTITMDLACAPSCSPNDPAEVR